MLRLAFALLLASAGAAWALTQAEYQTCAPDAMRLCSAELQTRNAATIRACMIRHRSQTSAACQEVIAKATKPRWRPHLPAFIKRHLPAPRPAVVHRPPPPKVIVPPTPPKIEVKPAPPPVVEPVVAPAPPVQPKAHPMKGIIDWILANLVLAGVIAYFVMRDGGPSVWRWFKRMFGYAVSVFTTVKDDVSAVVHNSPADVQALKDRIAALEAKANQAPPA